MTVKRINMDLDADLWKTAKKSAIDRDMDLREWVSEAIKEKLDREDVRSKTGVSSRVQSKKQG